MNYKIRELNLADAEAAKEIYNHYVLHSVASFEVEPIDTTEMESRLSVPIGKYPAIAAEFEGTLAGYCYAHVWKTKPAYSATWEVTIYLHPDHLGKGLGTKLMKRLMELCAPLNCHALIADITETNTSSVALFKKLGFERVSQFKESGYKFQQILNTVDYEYIFPNHRFR